MVEVSFAAVERDGGDDAVDLAFTNEPPWREGGPVAGDSSGTVTVLARAGRSRGRSFSVLTDQRSKPQASAAEKAAWPLVGGCSYSRGDGGGKGNQQDDQGPFHSTYLSMSLGRR